VSVLKAAIISKQGQVVGERELDPQVFGQEPNMALLHQVVVAEQAAVRRGTHSTRGRAEVAGGGAKPFRQKGTGNARQGSIRAPQFKGGGIVHGPKPRNYGQKLPKKMRQNALRQALSDRARENLIWLLEAGAISEISTKQASNLLGAAGLLGGRLLVIVDPGEIEIQKSVRNIEKVDVAAASGLSTYQVLRSDRVLFSESGLEQILERLAVSEEALQ
jgi:large subunit ribosomal protein L4